MDTSKVTRVEVINHDGTPGEDGFGRAFVLYTKIVSPAVLVTLSLQDDGRTLKVFIVPSAASAL